MSETQHLIDLDVDPFVPSGWKVEEHRKGGQLKWDASKVALYLSQKQQDGGYVRGPQLRVELAEKPVYNANLLDYLLANPHIIPEEWKGKYVFFWGTVYRDPHGDTYVRCLSSTNGRWRPHSIWLNDGWHPSSPAAVPAN